MEERRIESRVCRLVSVGCVRDSGGMGMNTPGTKCVCTLSVRTPLRNNILVT